MILHQENIIFKQHCLHMLGEYVQAEDEPLRTNTNAPWSLDCIYLRPSVNRQLGYNLLHLLINKIINRKKFFLFQSQLQLLTEFTALRKQMACQRVQNLLTAQETFFRTLVGLQKQSMTRVKRVLINFIGMTQLRSQKINILIQMTQIIMELILRMKFKNNRLI